MADIPQNGKLNKIDAQKKIQRHNTFRIIITIVLALILMLLLWGAIYSTADVNSYRIVVDGKRGGTLSLSFEKEFSGNGFSVLKGLGVRNTANAQGTGFGEGIEAYCDSVASGEIPMELELNGQAGKAAANGNDEFIASKFYLKNLSEVGSEPVKYQMRINVLENSGDALSAARFLVIFDTDGEKQKTVYAKPAIDGSREKVATKYRGSEEYYKDPINSNSDWYCTSFNQASTGQWYYDTYETDGLLLELTPQQAMGFCICVWYEGSDPEHGDDILGGYITFNVTFKVVSEE